MFLARWLFPIIGHMGICTSSGVIRDFAGPYFVSVSGGGAGAGLHLPCWPRSRPLPFAAQSSAGAVCEGHTLGAAARWRVAVGCQGQQPGWGEEGEGFLWSRLPAGNFGPKFSGFHVAEVAFQLPGPAAQQQIHPRPLNCSGLLELEGKGVLVWGNECS